MQFTNRVEIRRQPSEVFAFLADPANIPRWNYAIASSRQVTHGPLGVGTKLQQTRSLPAPAIEELLITEFAPGQRLTLRGDVGPLTGTLVYNLDEVPGGTRLTNVADLTARGPLRLLTPLVATRVRQAAAANLDRLRELLESSQ